MARIGVYSLPGIKKQVLMFEFCRKSGDHTHRIVVCK
jgi:hypothetical protein